MSDEVREAAVEYIVDAPVDEIGTAAELRPLLRLLERSDGFAVAFLEHNVPLEAERLVRELLVELADRGRPGDVLHLCEPTDDLLGAIKAFDQLPGRPLFVLGFERAIPLDQDFPPALTRLNMARELYRQLAFPVVLVLPEYALTKLAREAPDFWAWRSGVFEIEETARPAVETRTALELAEPTVRTSNAGAERHAAMLRGLLEESRRRGERTWDERWRLYQRLGATLRSLDRPEDAREHLEEAAHFARKAGELPAVAASLTELGHVLVELGQGQDGLEAAREAVAIRSQLAAENPWLNEADLATSLNTLSEILAINGEREEALEVAESMVNLMRRLTARTPGRYQIELARGLTNLSYHLSALGQHEDSLSPAAESVEIVRRLADRDPERYRELLASSLHNLGATFRELGKHEEALAAIRESLDLQRQSLSTSSENNRRAAYFAKSLHNYAASLADVGDSETALAASCEAVAIFRQLADSNPQYYAGDLAASLNNLFNTLHAVGESQEASIAVKEAVEIYRRLAGKGHQQYNSKLAGTLWNLARALADLGDLASSKDALREALALLEPIARQYPQSSEHIWWQRIQRKLEQLEAMAQ